MSAAMPWATHMAQASRVEKKVDIHRVCFPSVHMSSPPPLNDTDGKKGYLVLSMAFVKFAKKRAAQRKVVSLARESRSDGRRSNGKRGSCGENAALDKQCLCCKRWKFLDGKRAGCDTCNPFFGQSAFCVDCMNVARLPAYGGIRTSANLTGSNQARIAEESRKRFVKRWTGSCGCKKRPCLALQKKPAACASRRMGSATVDAMGGRVDKIGKRGRGEDTDESLKDKSERRRLRGKQRA